METSNSTQKLILRRVQRDLMGHRAGVAQPSFPDEPKLKKWKITDANCPIPESYHQNAMGEVCHNSFPMLSPIHLTIPWLHQSYLTNPSRTHRLNQFRSCLT